MVAVAEMVAVEETRPSVKWFLYMVQCLDGSFYTGVAQDVSRRVRQHNGELAGGSRYTRTRQPVTLVFSLECPSQTVALVLECAVKKLRAESKRKLAGHFASQFRG